MAHWTEYSRFFVALLVIIDPFAAIPLLLVLTKGYQRSERLRFCTTAALAVAGLLIFSALAGESLLDSMGTSLPSFRVGGGIVLLLMSLAMLNGQPDQVRTTQEETDEAGQKASIAVVPIAIPLLAGPGAISTVIIEMHRSTASVHGLAVIGVILAVSLLLWLALWLAVPIGRMLGTTGLNIINRLFGLVLAAIAVEIMANGLRELFPVLGG